MAGKVLNWMGRVVLALLGLVLFFMAALAVVLGTQAGTRFAVGQGLDFVPEASISEVKGSVLSGLSLAGVRYAADGLEFEANELWLDVNWPALLSGELHVRRLGLADARLVLPAGESGPEPGEAVDIEALIPELPIALRVDALELQRVSIVTAPGAEPIVLQALALTAAADAQAFEVSALSLALDAPVMLAAQADVRLAVAAPHALDLTLSADIGLEAGQGRLTLHTAGPLAELHTQGSADWQGVDSPAATLVLDIRHSFEQAVIEQLELAGLQGLFSLRGTVAWTDTPVWELEAQAHTLHLGDWVEAIEGPLDFVLQSSGRLQEDGTLAHRTRLSNASVTAAGVALNAVFADIEGGIDHARINQLSLQLLEGRLEAVGQVAWRDGLEWALRADADSINPAGLAPEVPGQVSFTLASEGRLDTDEGGLLHQSSLSKLTGELAGVGFEAIALSVGGDLETITVTDFSGRVLGAALSGQAELVLSEATRWQASLSLDEADLSLLGAHAQPTPAGRIGFDLATRGELKDGQAWGEFLLERLRGQIEGQTLDGRVLAALAGDALTLSPADIRLGPNRMQVSGRVTPPFDMRFSLQLPALESVPLLEQFGLRLSGQVEGEGELAGSLIQPRVEARLTASGVAVDDLLALDSLVLKASVNEARLDVTAQLKGLLAADEPVSRADLQMSGQLAAHTLMLEADTAHGTLALSGEGGVSDAVAGVWRGRLLDLSLAETQVGTWKLEEPAGLVLSGERLQVEPLCLAGNDGQGRVCASLRRASAAAPLDLTAEADLSLGLVSPWLPEELSLPGRLTLNASARLGDVIDASVKLALPDDILLYSGLSDESIRIAYRNLAVDARVANNRLQASLNGELVDYGTLQGQVNARLDGAQTLAGSIGFDMQSIAWLQAFAPELEQLAGRARLDLTLGGSLSQVQPSGELSVEDLSVVVPMAGVGFGDGRVSVVIDPDQAVRLDASIAGREQGELRIQGEGMATLPDWSMRLRLDGDAFAVMRSPEIDLDVSPTLVVEANPALVSVTGRIVLPLVTVRVHTLPPGTVSESSDLVLAGDVDEARSAMAVRTDLELVLGQRVSLEGMGFSTSLSGQIRIRGDETAPMSAFGEVDLRDGRYNAFGQNLAVDQGRLSFNGPLDDPGLDVRASRTVGEFQAGLQIRGTLNNPRSEVFSVPALPESDALSLLLTGRLLSAGSSGADATLLLNALGSLGLAQTDEILGDIGQKIGFDEIGLDTGNGFGAAQLSVGKRLNSRLMVRYMVGVFDGVGRFVTEYRINRFLDLEIVSSPVAQGGDLIYRIER